MGLIMKSAKILFIIAFLLAFAFQVSAQSAQFPNELEGFQFFGKGKLKKLTLGLSMKKDVELIFGELCEKNNCDYDENFTISINYLYEDDCMTTQVVRDRIMCPLSKFVGTIFSVELKPKRAFRFKEILTSNFNILGSGSLREKGSGESISYLSFSDKHGLKYSVYD